jgi:DNA-binding response OmpR family regulator
VIEDNPDTADSLAMLLDYDGYVPVIALTGRDGLALARALRPTIAILNLGLPDMNGYAVARLLRETLWPDHLLLIALTGHRRDRELEGTHGARFDHYLMKPVPFDAIRSILRAAVRR